MSEISEAHRETIKQRLKTDVGFVTGLQLTNGMSEEAIIAKAAQFMPDPEQPKAPEEE